MDVVIDLIWSEISSYSNRKNWSSLRVKIIWSSLFLYFLLPWYTTCISRHHNQERWLKVSLILNYSQSSLVINFCLASNSNLCMLLYRLYKTQRGRRFYQNIRDVLMAILVVVPIYILHANNVIHGDETYSSPQDCLHCFVQKSNHLVRVFLGESLLQANRFISHDGFNEQFKKLFLM